jgi:excisionase family DNA binding protein
MTMRSLMIDSEEPSGEDSSYVTIGDAARYLGVGRKIVYQLIDFGRIRSSRRRQMILVDQDSLNEFQRSGGLT